MLFSKKSVLNKLFFVIILLAIFILPSAKINGNEISGMSLEQSQQGNLDELSPFELKDELIKAAGDGFILNAGRGNPNFLATVPRYAFWQLGLFAMSESELNSALLPADVGGFPQREGIEERFRLFLSENEGVAGISFLSDAILYIQNQLGLNINDFLYEMCEGILGINYPVPPRMLTNTEKIVAQYLRREMIDGHPFEGEFDIFAVEGGTAAMTYIFNTMRENFLIKHGDTIALGSPIFTPYIEIPQLNDYQLNVIYLNADPSHGWQYSREELDKLRDPNVKAFFLVNPSNPPSVKMSTENLNYLAEIVKERPDLIILTDDVYGTFADDFVSLFALSPHNTILVYSFSKYFGSTGWRLGVVATHHQNILDEMLAALPAENKDQLNERYKSITTEPDKLKFIDRLVADSRSVALNHTAGLSTPQQVQMVLFSLYSLMDENESYKIALKHLIRSRKQALYAELGISTEHIDENMVDYYAILSVEYLLERGHGRELVDWIYENTGTSEILFRLASEEHVVLLPGQGFGTLNPSWRVSLAYLHEADYVLIGRAIRKMLDEYIELFELSSE